MTCSTLEGFYHIDGHTFEKQYREVLSGFRIWDQLEYADEWLLFPDNIGPRIAIDESSLSNGELHTFVTNRDACTGERALVAVVAGTKSEGLIAIADAFIQSVPTVNVTQLIEYLLFVGTHCRCVRNARTKWIINVSYSATKSKRLDFIQSTS